ncbi:MAG TPA: hypothetical protein VFZ37_15715 [Jiangellaceae bacterium]
MSAVTTKMVADAKNVSAARCSSHVVALSWFQKSGRNSALSDSLETKVPHADTDAWLRDPDTPALLSHPPDSLS